MKLIEAARVHFVGIGGAGMSALAKVLMERGVHVTGSDLKRSRPATLLEAMGARISFGHAEANVGGADAVIVSSAIPKRNPERARAGELGVTVMTRGEALAALLEEHTSLVVAGTHGKTTTTSMAISILHAGGLDPTYLVGGALNDAGSNAKSGSDDLIVAESDESDGSFLLLSPTVAVVTNVEADHLDHWASLDDIEAAFKTFITRTSRDGAVVLPAPYLDMRAATAAAGRKVITFGEGGDVCAENISVPDPWGTRFSLRTASGVAETTLCVPGMHNVANALAAAGACMQMGVSLEDAAHGLSRYRGVERRFQLRGRARGVTVVDEYAHHPTEVRASMAAARLGRWQRLVAVFQPHLYSRTAAFARDFGAAFADADAIVITDVYGARELPVPGVSGKLVADAACVCYPGRPVAYLPHRDELLRYLTGFLRDGDLLLTLGAGDVTLVGEAMLDRLRAAK
ncbi:MAG: UDP-N-acetylmuramate--L-alanine ligase [Actinomycetota bacterium]|nr:UDP-N-acetylmuramate--L-alanine ligase [Actinomycetota bacterium]